MKRISIIRTVILSLVLITSSMTAKAQLTKGSWLIGVGGSLYSSKHAVTFDTINWETDRLNVGLSPSIGYFIADKFAVGLKPSFYWSKSKAGTRPGDQDSSGKRFEFGPFARYYFLDKEKPFNILADVSYQYGKFWIHQQKEGTYTNAFSIMAGTVIFFNSSVGLELTLGYSSRIEEILDIKSTKKGLQVIAGFQIHLQKQ